MDNFAVKSDLKSNRIVEYRIPKEIRFLFLVILSADGKKGGVLNKIITDKEITLEERVNFIISSMFEPWFNNYEIDKDVRDYILKLCTHSMIESEKFRLEILADMKKSIISHLDSLAMPFSLKEFLGSSFQIEDASNKNTNIDADNYEELNPSNLKEYVTVVHPDALKLFMKNQYHYQNEFFYLYMSMINKVSQRWLELVVDFVKYRFSLIPELVPDIETLFEEAQQESEEEINKADFGIECRREINGITNNLLVNLLQDSHYSDYFDSSIIERYNGNNENDT
jgi:hypothetical protein